MQSGISQLLSEEMHTKVFWTFLDKKDLTFTTIKNSTQWVHESNASWIVSAVEIC